MIKSFQALRFTYTYEEFADHIKAMQTVREWEDTCRFGHLGGEQTSRANNARVVEYFCDSYEDEKEAIYKAELFLSIYDYLGRNAKVFARKDLLEELEGSLLSVDPVLLRAIHFIFTTTIKPAGIDPRRVLSLTRALKEIGIIF